MSGGLKSLVAHLTNSLLIPDVHLVLINDGKNEIYDNRFFGIRANCEVSNQWPLCYV